MKKLRSLLMVATIVLGAGAASLPGFQNHVYAQGTSASKSGGPSSTSDTSQLSDAELAYLLWLIAMWLIWGSL